MVGPRHTHPATPRNGGKTVEDVEVLSISVGLALVRCDGNLLGSITTLRYNSLLHAG